MKEDKIILLRDFVFKSMFKDSKNFREMLNRIFKYYFEFDFEDYNLTSEELEIFNKEDIRNRVDILMSNENINYYLNIEANIGHRNYYNNRNLLYEAKLVLHIFRQTEDYKKNFKIIQININDIKCLVDEEIIDSTMIMYDRKNEIKDERIVTHNLYLGKYKNIDYNNLKENEKDLAMLVCHNLDKMEILAKNDEVRQKVMSEYKKKISNEEFLEALWDPEWDKQMIINTERKIGREEGRKKGRKEGQKEGREEGIKKGKREGIKESKIATAKEMLADDVPIEKIAKYTTLTLEEIQNLK